MYHDLKLQNLMHVVCHKHSTLPQYVLYRTHTPLYDTCSYLSIGGFLQCEHALARNQAYGYAHEPAK